MNFKKAFSLKVISLIIVAVPLFHNVAYGMAVNDLRLPLSGSSREGQERLKDAMLMLTSRSELDNVLRQRAFNPLAAELITGMGVYDRLKIGNNDTVEVDLSWIGINDNIQIVFLEREDFDRRNPIVINGKYREDGQYRPYIKTIENESIKYFLPEDLTINELFYLIEDIDSLTTSKSHRLKLSSLFSQRFKFMAIYLAKEVPWDKLSDSQKELLGRQIELLYLLSNMLEEKPNQEIVSINEIKYRSLDLSDDKAWWIFKNHLKADLKLTQETLNQPDRLIEWAREAVRHMAQEFKAGKMDQLEHKIFIKGVEEMYSGLGAEYEPVKEELESLLQQPLERLLKDNLPIESWRERLKKAEPSQEIEVVKEIIGIIEKYKGWSESRVILDWSPKGILKNQELNCVGRAILVSRILKEIGIDESRVYATSFPRHAFLMLELSDKSYFMVDVFKDLSVIIKSIPKGYISSNLAMQNHIIVKLAEPLDHSYPESQFLSVSLLTEGLIAILHNSLAATISRTKCDTKYELARSYDRAIAEQKKAIRLLPKDASDQHFLGCLLFAKSTSLKDYDSEESIRLLDEAIYHHRLSIVFNKQYAISHVDLARALYEKSKVIIGFANKKKLLDRVIVEYNKAFMLNLDDPEGEIKKEFLIAELMRSRIVKELNNSLHNKTKYPGLEATVTSL
ncbi:MAG: hypothetical protein WC569_01695 [Candidatus Omnitrophota bacterium]